MSALRSRLRWVRTDDALRMVTAAGLALLVTNLVPGVDLERVWSADLRVGAAGHRLSIDTATVVVDGLMAAFFLAVGLEIRREMTYGSLRAPRAAAAPVVCAVGGMVAPMIIYRAFVPDGGGAAGWAIPSATDVALAVGIAALVAPHLSAGARAFLLTLAVADDLGGIAVISIWYSDGIALLPALGALSLAVLAALAVRTGVLTLGRALWLVVPALGLMYAAHIEPAIIGAVFGLTAPVGSAPRGRRVADDLQRILARLEPFVVRIVLPAFALVVASVPLDGTEVHVGVVLGVVCGLCIGKPLGVFGAWSLLARCGLADLPSGSTARELLGVSILAGIGFTVSLFIARAGLPSEPLRDSATIGVLLGSLLATGLAAWFFRYPVQLRQTPRS